MYRIVKDKYQKYTAIANRSFLLWKLANNLY